MFHCSSVTPSLPFISGSDFTLGALWSGHHPNAKLRCNCSSGHRIILVPPSGQRPVQQCFISAHLMAALCHSWEGDDLWGNDNCP